MHPAPSPSNKVFPWIPARNMDLPWAKSYPWNSGLQPFQPFFPLYTLWGKITLDERKKRFALTPFRRRGLLLPAHLCSRLHDQIPRLFPCPGYQGHSSSGFLLGLKSLPSPGHTHPCCWDGLDGMNLRSIITVISRKVRIGLKVTHFPFNLYPCLGTLGCLHVVTVNKIWH